jgi:hypothetical protein
VIVSVLLYPEVTIMRKLRKLGVPVGLVLAALALSGSAQAGGLEVSRMVICRGVAAREPVQPDSVFARDVGRLFCFTEIRGAETPTEIVHVWFWGEKEMARVRLPVRAERWRTWSSKRILPEWTGTWRVEVQDTAGSVLRTASFRIGSEAD